jgi:hypothetical protein
MPKISRIEMMHGKNGRKYGIWNDCAKQFQFGIAEDSPILAEARLIYKIGDDAKKWRFEPRILPECFGHRCTPNGRAENGCDDCSMRKKCEKEIKHG